MRRSHTALVVSALVVSALGLAAACTSSPSTPTADKTGRPARPTAVQPVRVVLPKIEAFVERERGLKFKHPVKATLLGRKAFLAKLHSGDQQPKPLEVEKETAVLAALGLISPRLDLVKAFKTATDAGTLGFYSSKSKRLYVKGTRATPGVRAVLAHELTHALTDQWFGIHRPKLSKGNQELSLGFDALIEGDAERTRKAYEATLNAADQRIAKREEGGNGKLPAKVPQIVFVFIGFPYVVGPDFVDAVVANGGLKALNAAYRNPPTSSEQLIDPQHYFAHDDPAHVGVPAADGPVLDHGDLGLVGLLLMLENHLSQREAGLGVRGWGGDQYVVWRAGDHRWCLRDTVVMDSGGTQIVNPLEQWAAASHGRAAVEQKGTRTTFRSCSS
jgi:hypothetical protein